MGLAQLTRKETFAAPAMLAAAFMNMECYIGLCAGERKPISAFSLTHLYIYEDMYSPSFVLIDKLLPDL
jgi:hypothetical protein